jgi:DNA repair protein RadC|tara:strand:- start:3531 stop:4196 length:666 start_codon:yes stop_codon:yes gene_type:complete
MKINDMPWWNKPSTRLKKEGVDKLNPAELLSLILWSGNKNENAIDMSNRLLKKYSFAKLSDLSLTELEKEVDQIKALKIKAMFEIFKITDKVKRKGFKPTIECAKDVYNYFIDDLKEKKKEHLYILMLDSKNRIIKEELISVGSLDSSLVHPRELFKVAIKESAFAIMLVHNHPSGDPEPSEEDIKMTKQIIEAGKILNILVLDHIIIGKDRFWNWLDFQS